MSSGNRRPVGRRAGDRSWQRWAARLAAAICLATLFALLPYQLAGGGSTRLDRVKRELRETQSESRALRRKNGELRREIDALRNSPGAIEDIARRELGMARPGELILRFEGDGP